MAEPFFEHREGPWAITIERREAFSRVVWAWSLDHDENGHIRSGVSAAPEDALSRAETRLRELVAGQA